MRLVAVLVVVVSTVASTVGSRPGLASLDPGASARAKRPAGPTRVERIGRIAVGDSIDGFPGICAERKRLEARGVKVRHAFYYVKAGLPARCMNLQCGPFARQILAHGGVLVGGARPEYVRELGLLDGPTAPGYVAPGLLVVTDLNGRVQALYRDASPADLTRILRDF